jgi:RhtB (resistance to homoserine/threonine) family protein
MLGTHDLLAFMLAGFILNVTPGPDTMYILTRTIAHGRRAGALSVLGICSGCLCHIAFAAFGLSALLAASALAFQAVKYAGALYLIWLGIQALRKKSALAGPGAIAVSASDWTIYRQGFITNLLNPKVALFFLAFLPQFVTSSAGLGPIPFLFLGAVFMSTGTLWCLTLVLLASRATQALRSSPRAVAWMEKLTGAVFLLLGLNLLRAEPEVP